MLQSASLEMNAARLAAIATYLLCAAVLGFRSPGMYYDEAIFFNGAVQMVNSGQEPAFAHDQWSWVTLLGRQWPIMVMPYVGSIRNYLAAIPFAAFGPNYYTARILSSLLGAIGIWGFSVLIRESFDAKTAAYTSWILAIHPGYLVLTIYQGGVGEWMLAFAALCITLARYLRAPSTLSAFWVGLAIGFGIWTRANVAWLIGSAILAAAIVVGKRILLPSRQLAAIATGTIIGAWPLLWYELRSDFATLRFMRSAALPDPLTDLISIRLQKLCEILISASDLRKMWDGAPPPVWQTLLFTAGVACALFICFTQSRNSNPARRIAVLIFLFLLACMLFSRLNIASHHMIALVPIAALIVVVAAGKVCRSWPRARYAIAAIALLYVTTAAQSNLAAARQIRSTGGVRWWSNAIDPLASYLQRNCEGKNIKVLDWGLSNNLFVLSNARIRPAELFWGATIQRSGLGNLWKDEISPGDVYVLHTPSLEYSPDAAEGFRRAVAGSPWSLRRTEFRQKNGAGYAEVVEILAP